MESIEELQAARELGQPSLSQASEKIHQRHMTPLISSLRRLQLVVSFYVSVVMAILSAIVILVSHNWSMVLLSGIVIYASWLAVPYAVELDEHYAFRKRYKAFRQAHRQGMTMMQAVNKTIVLEGPLDDPYESELITAANEKALPALRVVNGIERLDIADCVSLTEYNSYRVCIGRSMSVNRGEPVFIDFSKRHLRAIGISGMGKSSAIASMLKVIEQTHDIAHVAFVMLDPECDISKIFEQSPLLAHNGYAPLLAQDDDSVLACLHWVRELVDERFEGKKHGVNIDKEPLVLTYFEEFLDFKQRLGVDKSAEGKRRYEMFCADLKLLAARARKVRVILLLCGQTDYRDDVLVEALSNVKEGICLGLAPSAAKAAGFTQDELVKKNFQAKVAGQGVVEIGETQDLVLFPDYDVRARVRAVEASEHTVTLPAYDGSTALSGRIRGTTGSFSTSETETPRTTLDFNNQDAIAELARRVAYHLSGTLDGFVMPAPAMDEELQRGIELWNAGKQKNADFQNAFGVSLERARAIKSRVKDHLNIEE